MYFRPFFNTRPAGACKKSIPPRGRKWNRGGGRGKGDDINNRNSFITPAVLGLHFDKELMECQKYRELFFSQSKSPKGGGESVWTAITMIAVVIAVVCVAVNQIITNFTITELQSQQQQLEQQLEQLRTQQSE